MLFKGLRIYAPRIWIVVNLAELHRRVDLKKKKELVYLAEVGGKFKGFRVAGTFFVFFYLILFFIFIYRGGR